MLLTLLVGVLLVRGVDLPGLPGMLLIVSAASLVRAASEGLWMALRVVFSLAPLLLPVALPTAVDGGVVASKQGSVVLLLLQSSLSTVFSKVLMIIRTSSSTSTVLTVLTAIGTSSMVLLDTPTPTLIADAETDAGSDSTGTAVTVTRRGANKLMGKRDHPDDPVGVVCSCDVPVVVLVLVVVSRRCGKNEGLPITPTPASLRLNSRFNASHSCCTAASMDCKSLLTLANRCFSTLSVSNRPPSLWIASN